MNRKSYIQGLFSGGLAFTLWGLLPLYWKMVKALSPYQIFGHRVVWSFVFIVLILVYKRQAAIYLKGLKSWSILLANLAPAVFISINWLLYIWAVNNDYVLETSLGYYLNPLVLTLFGGMFFGERLTGIQKVGIGFAFIGVLYKTLMYGRVPWIALVLAVSFAIYGLLKKKSAYSSLMGLGFETFLVGVPAFIFLSLQEMHGSGITGNHSLAFFLLIMMSGVVTAVPLLLYAEGTKRLPLTVVGFLQYIAPTIGFFLGVFVFKEPFALGDLVPFALIWTGLGFFTYSQIIYLKKTGKRLPEDVANA